MSMLSIPDDLKQRLDTAAAARGISADELATEVLAAAVPTPPDAPRPLSFIGIGNSGRNDLGTHHRDIRRDLTRGLTANDV
jgi:plasmid stability protein